MYPNREAALAVEDQVDFILGVGYIHVGAPVPNIRPVFTPMAATPSPDVEDMAEVELLAPTGVSVKFFWVKEKGLLRVCEPGKGNRMAFSPAYLASHGWRMI